MSKTSNNGNTVDEKELVPVWAVTIRLGSETVEVLTTTRQVQSFYGGDYYEEYNPVGYLLPIKEELL